MGQVQRIVELAGMSTITLSTLWTFTSSVGVPRLAALEYPMGRPFGNPNDNEGQLKVLRATLQAMQDIEEPGQVVHLPFKWPEPARIARKESMPDQAPPITSFLKRRPWLFPKLLSGRSPVKK